MVISHKDSERIAVLEVRVGDHDKNFQVVFKNQDQMNKGIAKIHDTLVKILYVLVGTAVTLIVQEYGLHDLAWKVIKSIVL